MPTVLARPDAVKPDPLDIDTDQLDALIKRLQDARDYQLTLSAEDINILRSALVTLAEVQAQMGADQVTIHKLKKLLGMVRSSEKLRHLVGGAQDGTQADTDEAAAEARQQQKVDKKRAQLRTRQPRDRQEPVKVFHALADLAKGSPCPCCNPGGDAGGKVYKYEPAQFLRISERVRCNRCGEFFTAARPDEVIADGAGQQKYGYSARTVMALFAVIPSGESAGPAGAAPDRVNGLRSVRARRQCPVPGVQAAQAAGGRGRSLPSGRHHPTHPRSAAHREAAAQRPQSPPALRHLHLGRDCHADFGPGGGLIHPNTYC